MKYYSKQSLAVLLTLQLAVCFTVFSQQVNYFVSDGPGTPVYSKTGNPNDETAVVEWQIRLYSSDQVAGGGILWGTIDSKTYD